MSQSIPASPDTSPTAQAAVRPPWIPDQGDGTYRNPVLFADFSDPDAIQVGGDYYLVASTFSNAPGLTLLHSRDLVNWHYFGAALPEIRPAEHFSVPRHGGGVWAPSIRYHVGLFWIYYPDPDFGIHVTTAADPAGPWSAPKLVKAGKGFIDPCPLWDEDGRAYLIHAWARSRSGLCNIVTLHEMAADGTRLLDGGRVIIDGFKVEGCHTLEGPKFYKRNGEYFVFAPAGGVATGWQSVFRSKSVGGPYEHKIVLAQGSTAVNGPHQGAWVETPGGESWFLHFQDVGPFGRIVHLQPMQWREDGWPVMGDDPKRTGCGEPVARHRKPTTGDAQPIEAPATSDGFTGPRLGDQWQWEANPGTGFHSLRATSRGLRLNSQAVGDMMETPAVLSQRLPGPSCTVTTEIRFSPRADGERAGLIVLGMDYAWIGLVKTPGGCRLAQATRHDAIGRKPEEPCEGPLVPGGRVQLRVSVAADAACSFAYSLDGKTFLPLGPAFVARQGKWVGARVGLFALAPKGAAATGFAEISWFRVTA